MFPILMTSVEVYVVARVNVAELRSYPTGNLITALSFVPLKELAEPPKLTPG